MLFFRSNMSVLRKNTVIIDFSVLPVRPNAVKVHQFLEKEIQLDLAETESIQLHNIRNCVYIEVKDSETAARYQRLHNNRHLIYHGDKGFKIPVYVDSDIVAVRVHDLPPAIKHTTVFDSLSKYGEILSVTRERWKHYFPGVYNGVRVLHMKVKSAIPSFVTIGGYETTISYHNQPKSCRYCFNAAHPNQKCSEVSKTAITDTQAPQIISTDIQTKQTNDPTSHQLAVHSEEIHCLTDPSAFPPIVPCAILLQRTTIPIQQIQQTAIDEHRTDDRSKPQNISDDDDDDGNNSTSSHTSEVTKKRRLSTKNGKERKKLNHGSRSISQPVSDKR